MCAPASLCFPSHPLFKYHFLQVGPTDLRLMLWAIALQEGGNLQEQAIQTMIQALSTTSTGLAPTPSSDVGPEPSTLKFVRFEHLSLFRRVLRGVVQGTPHDPDIHEVCVLECVHGWVN